MVKTTSQEHLLSTKEREISSLNFMVVGDWGGQDNPPYYTDPEQDVAEQMGQIAAQMGAQFTLSMGDNFYENGVTDVDDPRFKETFEVRNYSWFLPQNSHGNITTIS